MTDEEIKALLAQQQQSIIETVNASISGAIARTQKETDKRFADFMANVPKSEEKPEAKQESSLELKALQQQLEEMQQAREADKAAAMQTHRDNAILSELGSRKVVSPSVLKQVLAGQYGDRLTQENGKWYVKDGDTAKPFSEVVTGFLESDDGKVFTPPASTVQGNGSRPGNLQQQPAAKGSLADKLKASLAASKPS